MIEFIILYCLGIATIVIDRLHNADWYGDNTTVNAHDYMVLAVVAIVWPAIPFIQSGLYLYDRFKR